MIRTQTETETPRAAFLPAKIIRIMTVPPVMAAVLILLLFFCRGAFAGAGIYIALFSLCMLPVSSYGLWYAVPALKRGGRDSQRKTAVICSVAGYVLNTACVLISGAGGCERLAVLTYLFSGLIIAVLSFAFHVKSSGHACGMSGPAFLLSISVHPAFLLLYVLLIPVAWSSLKLRRHTLFELVTGTLVPVAVQLILLATGVCTVA